MTEPGLDPETQVRRRRGLGAGDSIGDAVANSEDAGAVPTYLDIGYCVSDSGPSRGTPSPSPSGTFVRFLPDEAPVAAASSRSRAEFRKKQQSFEIQIEECEVEEMTGESDEDEEEAERPATPTQEALIQDYAINVDHKEGPQVSDFLQVHQIDNDCLTDVSDAESDD